MQIVPNVSVYLMPFSGKSVLAYHSLVNQQCNIAGFLDNSKQLDGKTYCGTPVQTPKNNQDGQILIVLCERKHTEENRIQLEHLLYSNFVDIENIITFSQAKQAIGDVDVPAFAKLAPTQFNAMKRLQKKYSEAMPECLLCHGGFAVSIASLMRTYDVCNPDCCLYSGTKREETIISEIHDSNRKSKPVVVFFTRYPFDKEVNDGFQKALLATDELFTENHFRIYIEPSNVEFICSNVAVSLPKDDLVHMVYSKNNTMHVKTVRSILKYSSLIYVHSIYYFDARVLFDIGKQIVLEIHSAVPEEFEYRDVLHMVKPLYHNEAAAFSICSRFICRNEVMVEYYSQKYHISKDKMIRFPSFSQFSLPKAKHFDHPIDSIERICVIFSGGSVKWHMIEMMLEGIKQHPEHSYIIASSEVDYFKDITKNMSAQMIDVLYVEPEQLEQLYRRAQYGYVLREDIFLNNVACPTKLIEYCVFGVVPIMLSNRIGDFELYGLKYVHYSDFLANKMPNEGTRLAMAENNYQIARKMADEYELCKKELKQLISGII